MTEKLENVEINWVYATKADRFGKYSLQAVLSDEHAAQLKRDGVTIKERDGKKVYNFTKPVTNKDGKETKPIGIYQHGKPFEGLVPNGAKAEIIYSPKEWSVAGRTGTKAYIVAVHLADDVVPYQLENSDNNSADDNPFE